MKSRKQTCSKCDGRKRVVVEIHNQEGETFRMTTETDCPKCNGEGFEVIITPKQWKEYQWLVKIADELEAKHIEVADLKKKD